MRAPAWLRGLLSRRAAPEPDLILSVRVGTFPTVQHVGQRIELHWRDAETGDSIRLDLAPWHAQVIGVALERHADAARTEAYQDYIRSQRLSHEDY